MFVLKSTFKKFMTSKDTLIKFLENEIRNVKYDKDCLVNKINSLKLELTCAKDLKSILATNTGAIATYIAKIENKEREESNNNLYVEDIIDGIVLKSKANKCIVIDEEGGVKIGLTKQKVDKNYNYKLIRQ
jgi:hypothetical protein